MRFSVQLVLSISVIFSFYSSSLLVNGVPQWVWNPDAASSPPRNDSDKKIIFGGTFAEEGIILKALKKKEKEKLPIKIVDTQARLFPSILGAISNSFNGGNRPGGSHIGYFPPSNNYHPGGSHIGAFPPSNNYHPGGSHLGSSTSNNYNPPPNSGGVGNGCTISSCSASASGKPTSSGTFVGQAIASQAIEQGIKAGTTIATNPSVGGIFSNFLQNIFGGNGGANTLPGTSSIGGIGADRDPATGTTISCNCVDASACYLPNQVTGNCESRRNLVRCCSSIRGGSRTVFPDDLNNIGSSSSSAFKTVTRSEIRRGLLRNIVRGSGSVIDDTLDLLLHPFLTREDQLKVATRIIDQ